MHGLRPFDGTKVVIRLPIRRRNRDRLHQYAANVRGHQSVGQHNHRGGILRGWRREPAQAEFGHGGVMSSGSRAVLDASLTRARRANKAKNNTPPTPQPDHGNGASCLGHGDALKNSQPNTCQPADDWDGRKKEEP